MDSWLTVVALIGSEDLTNPIESGKLGLLWTSCYLKCCMDEGISIQGITASSAAPRHNLSS